ncbi:VanZ family protein [Xylanimonas ulmi]|uniref:VanZ like protein n=1 Tax=Xylanimonas ulmi TaxID=228973 RepID=A0A4Q7M3Z7_9MICO|nr:VanZ family protein [Xylanibacterium ulmi]RZS61723.1 VanZ like protein [Xylanibacterium ulmi]
MVALFVVYLALLVWVVLWKLEVPHLAEGAVRKLKVVPFGSGLGARANTGVEVAGNLLLFVPFGLYLGLLAPAWRRRRVVAAAAAASLTLEVVQFALALGKADVTDVIVNAAGALVGLVLLAALRRRLGPRTRGVVTRACALATALALLACLAFAASPLHFGPQRAPSPAPSAPR